MAVLKDGERMLQVILSQEDQKILEEVKIRRQAKYGGRLENDSALVRALIREEADVCRIQQSDVSGLVDYKPVAGS